MVSTFYAKLYRLITHSRIRAILLSKIGELEGGLMYSPTIRELYQEIHKVSIGYGTYGGCFNLTNIPPNVEFGNYCSIAQHINIFRANHPKNTFTSHPLLYNPVAGYVKRDLLTRPKLKIGNDVWIGEGSIILPNVDTIGNGAIIGAGSIVTKNVKPYTIVAGNPAKPLSKRFNDDVIQSLEATKWWELTKEELIPIIPQLNQLVKEGNNSAL